ncbi:FAD-dependent oxidoreductase [Streptomyces lonegramiae]|uniref:FAD-dependent oxidoreductase n=1 Tax=Streptomyces lonegramiae TaxID=3075524 RepID=A0ABU2XJE3_9ACTN|nr:FAD-dependent oxidoreductase [Streptomyces sp. DSM 41529]MDT0545967.1 FAD-dependent oxidoreductase [Streptomyces sp. DSM 41529]
MTETETETETTMDADLIVVGGGPAGCAAVVMAAGLGIRSVLVESDESLCRALERVPVLSNVIGFATGPALAAAIRADVARSGLCRAELGRRAVRIDAHEDRVEVATVPAGAATGPGLLLTAPYAVVATGVGPLRPEDAGWIGGHRGLELPPLWEADPAALAGRSALVLGADRPLGTYLRAHPGLESRFVVACPPGDAYKAEEIAQDPRVELVPVRHLTLMLPAPGEPPSSEAPVMAEALTMEGERRPLTGHRGFRNLGSGPTPPGGDLSADASGYCPPALQHPRVFTAGDLRSARFQRIATAMGSGSEAALGAYYASRGLPTEVTDDVPPHA